VTAVIEWNAVYVHQVPSLVSFCLSLKRYMILYRIHRLTYAQMTPNKLNLLHGTKQKWLRCCSETAWRSIWFTNIVMHKNTSHFTDAHTVLKHFPLKCLCFPYLTLNEWHWTRTQGRAMCPAVINVKYLKLKKDEHKNRTNSVTVQEAILLGRLTCSCSLWFMEQASFTQG